MRWVVNCPCVHLVRKLLRAHADTIEEISFVQMPSILEFRKPIWLPLMPQLKTICFDISFHKLRPEFCRSEFLRAIVDSAINLEPVNMSLHSWEVLSLPDRMLKCVKVYFIFSTDGFETHRLTNAAPQLVNLAMHVGLKESVPNLQVHVAAMEMLLQSSAHTLKRLIIDTSTAAALADMQVHSLLTLTDLTIYGQLADFSDERLQAALFHLDFELLFPEVHKIEIDSGVGDFHSSLMVLRELVIPQLPPANERDRNGNIRQLRIDEWKDGDCASLLSTVFPNVAHVSAKSVTNRR